MVNNSVSVNNVFILIYNTVQKRMRIKFILNFSHCTILTNLFTFAEKKRLLFYDKPIPIGNLNQKIMAPWRIPIAIGSIAKKIMAPWRNCIAHQISALRVGG